MTSTREARAAGISDASTAAATRIIAAATIGSAPGMRTSSMYAPTSRASANPPTAPATMPMPAITAPSLQDARQQCIGADPIASRMPNSRVRALTENASTPATPTTAIVSATAAKPPNTSAFSRSGASTSARTSSSVAALLDRLIGRQLADDARDRRHQRVRIGARVHEQPAAADLLLERVIDGHRRPGHDVLVVDVGDDADDAARLGADVDELHHRIGPHQAAVERVLVGEHPLREALADDDDLLGVAAIGVGEVAAGDERHAERGEESRRDACGTRARILFAVGLRVALDRELEARTERPGVAPRHDACRRRRARRPAARRCAACTSL